MSLMPNLLHGDGQTVLVVDETPLFGRGVLDVIRTDPAYQLAEYANSFNEALGLWGRHRFHIVLLSASLPEGKGLKLLSMMKEMDPNVKVLVMAAENFPHVLEQAFSLGADGYVLKEMTPTHLLVYLRDVVTGRLIVDKKLSEQLHSVLHHEDTDNDDPLKGLTEKERMVLKCLMQGLTNKGIARILGTTEGTIKAHVKHLLLKLDCRSRVDVAVWAAEHKRALDKIQVTPL